MWVRNLLRPNLPPTKYAPGVVGPDSQTSRIIQPRTAEGRPGCSGGWLRRRRGRPDDEGKEQSYSAPNTVANQVGSLSHGSRLANTQTAAKIIYGNEDQATHLNILGAAAARTRPTASTLKASELTVIPLTFQA